MPLPRAPDPALDPAAYLRSIYSVRERSKLVLEKAKKNQLKHFTVDMSKFTETAKYIVSIIKVGSYILEVVWIYRRHVSRGSGQKQNKN